jgi:hypothetical protein
MKIMFKKMNYARNGVAVQGQVMPLQLISMQFTMQRIDIRDLM